MHAEERFGGDHGGADIERGAGHRRHPALVDLHQGADRFLHHRGVDFRDAQIVGGFVEAPGMVRRAKQADLAILAAEGFQAVEDRLAVVQHAGGGIQRERRVWLDAGIVPALPVLVVHQEHVVGEDLSECQRLVGRGLFRRCSPGDRDLVHCGSRFV